MNKFLILLIVMSLLVSNIVFANVTCQYKGVGQYNETEQLLVDNSNNNQGDIPKFSDFITEENNITSFIIYNPNRFKILVYLNFTIEGFGGGGKSYGIDIKPLQNRKVEELCYANDKSGYCFINESSITYFVSTPDSPNLSILYPKNLTLTKTKLVCKLCNNAPCLDDGAECSTNEECGGGYCIEKICNNKPECFLDNCKCERFDKIQCKNTRCVSKNTLPEGDMPFCGPIECKTNYTDNNGRCAKSSEQKDTEAEQKAKDKARRESILLTLSIVTILAIIVLAFYINKKKGREIARKEAEKTIKKATQTATRLIQEAKTGIIKINKEIEQKGTKKRQLEEDLSSLEKESKDAVGKKEQLVRINDEIKILIENEDQKIKQLLEYYEKRHGPKFVLDNGYIRFEKSWTNPLEKGEYFHIWWFEKNHERKIKPGYQIHHKDFNKWNNDLANLEELTPTQHQQKHLNKFSN